MDIQVHVCNACGAELMINETEAATFCSYCGSSAIVFDRISKEEKPKWIHLAKVLGLPKGAVSIAHGASGRIKLAELPDGTDLSPLS